MMKNIPYGKQTISEKDTKNVLKTIRSEFLTTGPTTKIFEEKGIELVENTPEEIRRIFSIPLKEMTINSPRNLLRVIHYPPLRETDNPEEVRAAAHEDINLLTVLCSATAPGLQAQDLEGNWHEVPCDSGMLAVNTGDMLQMASGGYFPSTTHRVINPPGEDKHLSRMSMPLFLHPHDYIQLSDTHTAGDYLTERLEEIGLI